MFVACFCLCEFMCLSRDCMYLAFTRARVRMYERERERERMSKRLLLEREGVGARQILLQKFDERRKDF